MRSSPFYFILMTVYLGAFASYSEALDPPDLKTLKGFMKDHCFSCHGEQKAKGDLRLDTLSFDFSDEAAEETWQLVIEKLELGEMPPKKSRQPEPNHIREALQTIRSGLKATGQEIAVDHKLRSPEFGNHVDHQKLFDGSQKGPSYSPARLWRMSPQAYKKTIERMARGVRHASAIHQPFPLDDTKGLIANYAAQHFADAATLELLLLNCETLAKYQTVGIVKRKWDGRLHRHRRTPEFFKQIIEGEQAPSRQLLTEALQFEYQLLLDRSPTELELQSSLKFAETAIAKAGPISGFQTALISIMLKPEAVYRLEIGLGKPDGYGRRRLSDFELAFALAYALTDRGPSQVRIFEASDSGKEQTSKSLLDLALSGQLNTKNQIQKVVKTILDQNDMSTADYTMFAEDHKVRNITVLRFFRQFFGYHHADRVFKDEKRIGINSGFETKRIIQDADQFVMHIFDEDKNVIRELLTSNRYFVAYPGSYEKFLKDSNYIRNNKNDANYKNNVIYITKAEKEGRTPIPIEGTSSRTYVKFYNLDHETWDFPIKQPFGLPKAERAGMLTHPAWLIAWSGNFDNDPIRRGKWIREHLLADTIPDVPITVNAVVPEDPHKTLRQRLEATREEYCWTCHKKMNPLGLPFEQFDDFGRLRKKEMIGELLSIFPERHRKAKYLPLNVMGEIIESGEPRLDGEVSSPFELVKNLAQSRRVQQSFIRHAFRFWMGRNETLTDSPTLIEAEKAYIQNGGSMKMMIASLLSSDSFLYRK